jgi:hypothetical protein
MSIRSHWLGGVLLGLWLGGCDDAGTSSEPPAFREHARVGSRGNFVGVFEPATATWQLNLQRPGWNEPAGTRTFVFGAPGDTPVVGDWDGDGAQTPGTFRAGTWSLRNVLGEGAPELSFRFGEDGDLPVVGDWDGDGVATVGVFKDGKFSLRNSNAEGPADLVPRLGASGDIPVAGDWDGDGRDTVGVYKPDGTFLLLDADGPKVALGIAGGQPIAGDWDDNRHDTVGVRHGSDWTLLNDHRVWSGEHLEYGMDAEVYGLGEIALSFGEPGAIPVAGNWLPMASPGYPEAPSELRAFFPLAADYQNPDRFELWADAGINTMIRVRSATDPDAASPQEVEAWTAKANELGLKMIREPRADLAADDAEPNLLAFFLKDEPDIYDSDPFPSIEQKAAELRREGTRPIPIFVNFAGWSILHQNAFRYGPGDRNPDDFYSRYVALEDWASQDTYAVSQMFRQVGMNLDDAMATLPLTFNKLRRWSPTKPQFAFIETSQHNGTSRLLSPDEFRAQVWLAIVGGARGIFYFAAGDCGHPECRTPDGTQPDVRAELRTQNARITRLTHVLQGDINPLSFSVSAPAPLEVGWRASEDGNYIFAVNATTQDIEPWIRIEGKLASDAIEVLDENRTIETVGGYTFKDHFAPYDARVYRFR